MKTKEVTALTEKLHQAFEPEERAKLATELQQKILDDDGFFFVSHLNMGIVTKSNVKGMRLISVIIMRLRQIWMWNN